MPEVSNTAGSNAADRTVGIVGGALERGLDELGTCSARPPFAGLSVKAKLA